MSKNIDSGQTVADALINFCRWHKQAIKWRQHSMLFFSKIGVCRKMKVNLGSWKILVEENLHNAGWIDSLILPKSRTPRFLRLKITKEASFVEIPEKIELFKKGLIANSYTSELRKDKSKSKLGRFYESFYVKDSTKVSITCRVQWKQIWGQCFLHAAASTWWERCSVFDIFPRDGIISADYEVQTTNAGELRPPDTRKQN